MSSIQYVDWFEYDNNVDWVEYDINRTIKSSVAFIAMQSKIPFLEIHYPDGSSKEVEFTRVIADFYHITPDNLQILIEDAKRTFPNGDIYVERPLIKMTPEEQWWEIYDYLENSDDILDAFQKRKEAEYNKNHWDKLTEKEKENLEDHLYESFMEEKVDEFLKNLLGKEWKGR